MNSGIILIDKPLEITSRDTLLQVQKKMNFPKVGHTGTLDPLATGLLVFLVGQAIKVQHILALHDKEYETCIHLGANSDTDDKAGNIVACPVEKEPSMESVQEVLKTFLGEIDQVPPKYSSVHINGRRAHNMARKGVEFSIPARKVYIEKINIESYQYPYLKLTIKCGTGTYIRSLARDVGEKLKTGGYVESLCRTKVGVFSLKDASTVDDISFDAIVPIEQALRNYARISILKEDWYFIRTGQKICLPTSTKTISCPTFLWCEDKVIAVAKIKEDQVSARRILVNNTSIL